MSTLDSTTDAAESGSAPQQLIDVLTGLSESGLNSVVTEGAVSQFQKDLHVPDAIEDWVASQISAWRANADEGSLLMILSGNAGDGKSELIERLREREDVRGDDLSVVADATHSESPSDSQTTRLLEVLAGFSADPDVPLPERECVLIAMNVGMVIAFFDELEGEDKARLKTLEAVIRQRLDLSDEAADPPSHWRCEVVNLDHRNLLGLNDDGLLSGMLEKLDPDGQDSITREAAKGCEDCSARSCCWVRTNLNILRKPSVRDALHDVIWEATLGSGVHLSPRNVWNALFEMTTGGTEPPESFNDRKPISCDVLRNNLPADPTTMNRSQFDEVQRRLLYNTVFDAPATKTRSRGGVLDAIAAVDPIARTGKQTHLAETKVSVSPTSDRDQFSLLAEQLDGPEHAKRDDPLLAGMAELLADPMSFLESTPDEGAGLVRGVARRARLTGQPAEVAREVTSTSAIAYRALLMDYAEFSAPDGSQPPSIGKFWKHTLVKGLANIFGLRVNEKTYFRLDTLSPTTRFMPHVEVDLEKKIGIDNDAVTLQELGWLAAISYLPRALAATVDVGGSGKPWVVPIDLHLYRLLLRVNEGYSASSVDMDAFFRLRYACARLGSSDSSSIMFRSTEDGSMSQLKEVTRLPGEPLEREFTRVKT